MIERNLRHAALAIAVLCAPHAARAADATGAAMPPAQPQSFWNVWVDSAGGTHQTKCRFEAFRPFSLGRNVEGIYVDKLAQKPEAVWIAQFPKGWVGAWHENPKPQWTIPLSGRWFVETTDKTRVEMGPGDASYGGDQGAKPDRAGHVGHLSGTLGDGPITLMFVQGPAPSQSGNCRFR